MKNIPKPVGVCRIAMKTAVKVAIAMMLINPKNSLAETIRVSIDDVYRE